MIDLELTTERVVPGKTPVEIERKHRIRYATFASWATGKTVLDAACGAGYGSEILFLAGAESVTGIDISEDAIRYANERYGRPGLTYEVMDLCDLRGGPYQRVVSFESIEHVQDTEAVLRGFHRVLVDGGILILGAPQAGTIRESEWHFHQLDYRDMIQRLTARGFTVLEEWGQNEPERLFRQESRLDTPRHWFLVAQK